MAPVLALFLLADTYIMVKFIFNDNSLTLEPSEAHVRAESVITRVLIENDQQ